MFWDQVAGVYDVFVNVINRKTHKKLRQIVSALIELKISLFQRLTSPHWPFRTAALIRSWQET